MFVVYVLSFAFKILANNERPTIDVEPRYFAGALILLQEAGEITQVGAKF